MTDYSIIGKVAATRIAEELVSDDGAPPSRLLYGIIDLDPAIVCAVAKEVAKLTSSRGKVQVFVHPAIASAGGGDIGHAEQSLETATYHRGNTSEDVVLTVFSVPTEDTASVRQSLAHVSVINSDWLTDDMRRWSQAAMPNANETLKGQLGNILTGLKASGVVPEVGMYADFVTEEERLRTRGGMPVMEATRKALPSLRLPTNAGDARGVEDNPEKAKAYFRKVFEESRPYLYLRTKDGEPLNAVELKRRLAETEMDPAAESVLRALLDNPEVGGARWLPEQEALAKISWDLVEPFFSESKKKVAVNFGGETAEFFKSKHPGVLEKDEEELLNALTRDSVTPKEAHATFFAKHADLIQDNPKLFKRWEKLVFKKPVEADDLQDGLLRLVHQTMQNINEEAELADPLVYIRLRKSRELNFWQEDKNTRLCRYLRDRYRGLDRLMGKNVALDFGRCWEDWDTPSITDNVNESKAAVFEFDAYLVERADYESPLRDQSQKWDSHLRQKQKAQMVWSPPAQSMGIAFSEDIQELATVGDTGQVPLLRSEVSANRYDKYGTVQTIDLDNQSTILDAQKNSGGNLVNHQVEANLVAPQFIAALEVLTADGIVTQEGSARVCSAFEAFRTAYSDAIKAFASGHGLADPASIGQADRLRELLEVLRSDARAPKAIKGLWLPLLQIGVAAIRSDREMALVSAWAPLRLAEISAKAHQLGFAMQEIFEKYDDFSNDMTSHVKEKARNLAATYYQEVTLSFSERPSLLAETVKSLDVSLMESPSPGDTVGSDEPVDGLAESFDKVAGDYLRLRPHEKANFSTMLYNSESEALPVRLADHMASLMEDEPSLRCDLVLTHEDGAHLRRIYQYQNRRIGAEFDSELTSEAARTFLSRLRVGIISPESLGDNYGKANDIVILHGAIARKATTKWSRVPGVARDMPLTQHVPVSHSKKRPFHKGDTASATFLTSPDLNMTSQAYLDAIRACEVGEAEDGHWMPVQEVQFDSGSVKDMMSKAHSLGEWVLTYDRIADRRLLSRDDRRILRYYSSPRSDHNVIVSTEINAGKLAERLRGDIKNAIPSADYADVENIVRAIHAQSASLSGAIVMRGVERVNHGHELLGLVLSRREIESLLQSQTPGDAQKTAWFFIDDYLSWLEIGSMRADIMAVNFAEVDGKHMVRIVVAEAKYVALEDMNAHKQKSMEQLAATVRDLHNRLVSKEGTIDPGRWRSRIADLVLEHIDPFDQIAGMPFEGWLLGLRDGSLPITVSGHSLVYVHGMDSDPAPGPLVPVDDKGNTRFLAQWTFGRPSIASGFKNLVKERSPARISVPAEWSANPYTTPVEGSETIDAGIAGIAERIEEVSRKVIETGSALTTPPKDTSSVERSTVTKREPEHGIPVATPAAETIASEPHVVGQTSALVALVPEIAEPTPKGWLPEVWEALMGMRKPGHLDQGSEWLDEQADAVRDALQANGYKVVILDKRLTPNSALITIDGASGVDVAWLEKQSVNLQTKYGLEIGRVTPMTRRIAISINRPKRAEMHLSEAWHRRKLDLTSPDRTSALVVGDREVDGELLYLPLFGSFEDLPQALPHTIVSGGTNSGKGILTTNLILDICAFNSPDAVRIRLIDPKRGADYGWLMDMPHFDGQIASEADDIVRALASLTAEMERRLTILGDLKIPNIALYNETRPPTERLPRIVMVFDEVPKIMQDEDFRDRANPYLNELATAARSSGIHLVMIYQRADNLVMTMQLRNNLGNKLILKLGDKGSSEIALGEKGAERLLGFGHLIAKVSTDDRVYAQVPFLHPTNETPKIAEAIIRGWKARK